MGTNSTRTQFRSLVLTAALTATLAAACGGSSSTPASPTPTPTPTPTPPPANNPPAATAALSALSLASSSVVGGNGVQGTVTLTAAAPAGGSVVTLTSNQANAVVPANVTVPAGQSTATFSITTTSVTEARDAVITATMSGVSRTATLSVTTAELRSVFSVVSNSRGSNACALLDGGNTIDCTFNGSASTGAVRTWIWEYAVGSSQDRNTSSEPITRPQPGCGFFRGHTPSSQGGTQFLQMVVTLTVLDARGQASQPVTNGNVRVFPNQNCGYAF